MCSSDLGWTVTGPAYFAAPIESPQQPVTLGYFLDHSITDLGGTISGPLYLTAPINSGAPNQAITVSYVANVLRSGNGVSINSLNQVETVDCGIFVPA